MGNFVRSWFVSMACFKKLYVQDRPVGLTGCDDGLSHNAVLAETNLIKS